ncbi:hypothetical protein OsI_20973 [Oryza sativa Indica Group]|uniref:Uncharacterized protein n=1 Tax=Oryza sativa subsp. indica TaxID=39946 RepID=B8AWQ4_ORYSI|nr:hypothetical protein OsI_20973 [Oryza sativa Indica Group]
MKGKCIARSDTFEEPIYVQDDNTDPSNSDSHGLTTCLPRQQQSEKLHDYTVSSHINSDLLGPSNSENEASEHIDQQSYQAVDHANPILGMAPTAHHRPLNSSAQVTAAVHHELDQGFQMQDKCGLEWLVSAAAVGEATMRASATLDQSNDDNLAVVTCQRQPEHCETQMTKEVACPRPACMSPFSMPILHEWPNAKLARRLYRWLELKSRDEDITGVWFKHDKPTPIEISAMKLKMQLIAPVELAGGTWSCYIWDMEKRQMHILDPVLQQRETYNGSITALRKDLLYQLLTMEGNYAELPSHIARYLE